MKKLMMLILGVLLFIPAIALADMGAPAIRKYKVTPKSEEGAPYYEVRYNDDRTAEIIKKGTINYKEEVTIQMEETINDELYGSSWDDGNRYFKLSDYKVVGENNNKDDAPYAGKVFAKDGLEIYTGPGGAYEKTGKTIPYNTDVAASDFLDGGTWVCVVYGDVKGYVNAEKGGLGILYEGWLIDKKTNKEYSSYYDIDDWSWGVMVEENGSYKMLNTVEEAVFKFYYKNNTKVIADFDLQKTGEFDSEKIAHVSKGDTVTILYTGGRWGQSYTYVDYNGQKGWINLDYNNGVENPLESLDWETLEKTEDYKEWNEGKVLADEVLNKKEGKEKSSTKVTNPNTILIGSIVAGGAIVLASIVTIILVNKNKKKTNEE